MAAIFAECRACSETERHHDRDVHAQGQRLGRLDQGLIKAGFVITASWPVNTEAEGSLHIKDKAAANSTIFLVCRPRLPSRLTKPRIGRMWNRWFEGRPEPCRRISEGRDRRRRFVSRLLRPALEEFSRHWPLKRGTPRPEPLEKKASQAGRTVRGGVRPLFCDAGRRPRSRPPRSEDWRLNQLTHTKGRGDLDATTPGSCWPGTPSRRLCSATTKACASPARSGPTWTAS